MATSKRRSRRVRLHENLTLLEVAEPAQLHRLRDLPEVRAAMVRVIDEETVVLDPDRVPQLLAALEKHGLLPRVTESGRED
jgi:hypothetical protein